MTTDGQIARHGWAALLVMLQTKGLINQEDANWVIKMAHDGASRAAELGVTGVAHMDRPQF